MTHPASEQINALDERMTSMEGDIKQIGLTLTRIESAIIGLDGNGGLLRKVDRMDDDVLTLLSDYHARKAVQAFVAPFWAAVGGIVVLLSDRIIGRFF